MIGGNWNTNNLKYNTYDNLGGTIPSLLKRFNEEIIRDREQLPMQGHSTLDQLNEILRSKEKRGTIVFLFSTDDHKTALLEKVHVDVIE